MVGNVYFCLWFGRFVHSLLYFEVLLVYCVVISVFVACAVELLRIVSLLFVFVLVCFVGFRHLLICFEFCFKDWLGFVSTTVFSCCLGFDWIDFVKLWNLVPSCFVTAVFCFELDIGW